MSIQLSNELSLLCWAASDVLPRPDGLGFDEEELFRLAVEHRLVPRLLARIEKEFFPAVSSGMRARLRFARLEIEQRMKLQARKAREIASLVTASPIYFKGFTAYALTGERAVIRQSGDIDFLAHDPDALFDAMRAAGYRGDYKANDYRHERHEHSEWMGDGVAVDLHRYHLVHSSQLMGDAADFPDSWSGDFQTIPVTYSVLKPFIMESLVPETKGLTILNPTAAALLLCCHIGMAAVRLPILPVTTIGELADLLLLMRHPDFSPDDFLGLVHRLKAEAIVRLSVALARQFLGTVSLPCFDDVSIPEITAAPDGWACFGMPFDELLLAGNLADTIDRLGACPITRTGDWYGIRPRPGYGKLEGAIVRGESVDVSVAVSLTPANLQITVRWADPLPAENELHIWYLISNYAARQSVRYQAGKPIYSEGLGPADPSTDAEGITIRVTIALEHPEELPVPLDFPSSAPIPIMVYAMQWSGQVHGPQGASPIVVLPLMLMPSVSETEHLL